MLTRTSTTRPPSVGCTGGALISAVVPGAARQAVVLLFAESGTRNFRVSAVSLTGIEGPCSEEYAQDTTGRLAFRADKDSRDAQEPYTIPAAGGDVFWSDWSPLSN